MTKNYADNAEQMMYQMHIERYFTLMSLSVRVIIKPTRMCSYAVDTSRHKNICHKTYCSCCCYCMHLTCDVMTSVAWQQCQQLNEAGTSYHPASSEEQDSMTWNIIWTLPHGHKLEAGNAHLLWQVAQWPSAIHNWFNVDHCLRGRSNYKLPMLSLTLSSPMLSNGYTSKCSGPYWSNPPFLIFWHSGLWRSRMSAIVPKCQKN